MTPSIDLLLGLFSLYSKIEPLKLVLLEFTLAFVGVISIALSPYVLESKSKTKKLFFYAIASPFVLCLLRLYWSYSSLLGVVVFTLVLLFCLAKPNNSKIPLVFNVVFSLMIFFAIVFAQSIESDKINIIRNSDEIVKYYKTDSSGKKLENENVQYALNLICFEKNEKISAAHTTIATKPGFSCSDSTTKLLLASVSSSDIEKASVGFDGDDKEVESLTYITLALKSISYKVALGEKASSESVKYFDKVAPHLKQKHVELVHKSIANELAITGVVEHLENAKTLQAMATVINSDLFKGNENLREDLRKTALEIIDATRVNKLSRIIDSTEKMLKTDKAAI